MIKQQDIKKAVQKLANCFKISKLIRYTVILIIIIFAIHFSPLSTNAEKIYIDITSPGIKKFPIAIQNFVGGKEVSDIIKEDLDFTGIFYCIDDSAQIERPEDPFNPLNWKGLGVEVVLKGRVVTGKNISVVISAYDVSEEKELLKKEYTAPTSLIRPLAHSISNDIYKLLTGQKGIFRTKISFVVHHKEQKNQEIFIMDWDGHRMQGLNIKANILLTPRWSTDGSKLLYTAERNRSWDVYMLEMNTFKEKNVLAIRGLNISGNFFPNNREFVFSSTMDGKSDIYIADIVNMKGRKLISSPWIDVSPSVSPEGNSLLFVSNRSGTPQIYIADIDGYGIKRLTFTGAYNTSPVWSPTGDRIAFVGMSGSKNQIFTMKPDGSDLRQLTDKGNNEDPSFSPDGRYIAFTSDRDGIKGIYIMRLNGEEQKRITPKNIKASNPSWSP